MLNRSVIPAILTLTFLAIADGTLVGVLSGHESNGWSNFSCKNVGLQQIMCNLQVYEAAAASAAGKGVELLVYPEAYALAGMPSMTGFYEPQLSVVGKAPCTVADASSAPQQSSISCMAKRHGIAIASNIFTKLTNGSRRITEIVFDRNGVVVAIHDKIHLAPVAETSIFEVGTIKATTFDLLGRRWGILICYEGVYPYTLGLGDFSEMDELVAQGATAFVWSIGGAVPPEHVSSWLATKYKVPVVASEVKSFDSTVSAIVDASGKELIQSSLPLNLAGIGYTSQAVVSIGTISSAVIV